MKKKKVIVILIFFLVIGGWLLTTQLRNQIKPTQNRQAPDFWSLAPDTRLMARTISAEARGELYQGQVAVGAVIMNRVQDSRFPNTVAGVIYQPWAFTAVAYGQIWNHTPNSTTVRATMDAMSGWDPSYGAVYYYNPVKVTSNWIFSRDTIRTLGKHVFAR
ncbi:cell wall hydrolase [Selenihalanaerobacter shriftii]|uniref:N-acetylmuramoyl-L-alanine amidase n=1 Tax=Selenihalanaerobacter shriftii TaxID=142842 RepID=A0A1T4PTC5_9FIRM|nr:cell wall hydrolase [Selenihalanaerobacter shriftii]SJZ94556.1 N-acetylmuramoyl-L-alanine amidase [Selenihalanaerobacter shriftii]